MQTSILRFLQVGHKIPKRILWKNLRVRVFAAPGIDRVLCHAYGAYLEEFLTTEQRRKHPWGGVTSLEPTDFAGIIQF